MKLFHAVMVVGIVVLSFGCASKEVKPTHSDAAQQEEIILAPSSFYEACEKLTPGQRVKFSFAASRPVDFNVHYHTTEGITYPVKETAVESHSGELTAEAKAVYCCMWTNDHMWPVSVACSFNIVEE